MGLKHLSVMHEAPHLFSRRREAVPGPRPDDDIHRLGCGQVVANRADAAQALDQHRGLPVRPALDKALKAAEFDDVEPRLRHVIVIVEMYGYLSVSLDSCYRFYFNL